jgi:hypothetical protein
MTAPSKQRYPFSEYFDKESEAIVAEAPKNDIPLLGYEFDCL